MVSKAITDRAWSAAELLLETGAEKQAASLGVQREPKADGPPPRVERDIVERVNASIRFRQEEVIDELAAIKGELQLLEVSARNVDVSDVPSRVCGRLTATFQNSRPTIREIVKGEREGLSHLNVFRERNRVTDRDARYAPSKIKAMAVPLATTIADSAGIGIMLAGSGEMSYLSAWLTAIGVGVSTNGLSALAAWSMRYFNLPNYTEAPNRKLWGRAWSVPLAATSVGVVGACDFFLMHVRELSARGGEGFNEAAALVHAIQHPTDLSLTSIGLGLFNVLCQAFTAYKVYVSTDPLPGYEREDRAYTERREARDDLVLSLQGQHDAVQSSEVDSVSNRLAAERSIVEDLRRRALALAGRLARISELNALDKEAGHSAIASFRALNLRVRTDNVIPKCFGVSATFAENLQSASLAELDHLFDKVDAAQRACADRVQMVLEQERGRIEAAKENTEGIMLAIERFSVSEEDIPKLAEVRSLLRLPSQEVRAVEGKAA